MSNRGTNNNQIFVFHDHNPDTAIFSRFYWCHGFRCLSLPHDCLSGTLEKRIRDGASQGTVSRLRKRFLAGKMQELERKSGWGGGRRGNLSEAEEMKFINKWTAAALQER